MRSVDDRELLRLAIAGSREALTEIVRRHAGFVYASAVRQTRDRALADDVTQAVFIILARKVQTLKPKTLMPAWLFHTTRYVSANAIRTQARRRDHERRAASMRREDAEMSDDDDQNVLEPLLDDALASLREIDRSAVLLSYFAGKNWREVAEAIGTTEEAARKRVERALMGMRNFFRHRGIVTTSLGLIATMEASTKASVPHAALLAAGNAVAGGSAAGAVALIPGAVNLLFLAQLKVAAAWTIVSLAALGAAGAMALNRQSPQPAKAPNTLVAELDDGVSIELLAISSLSDDDPTWWHADGSLSDERFNDSTSEDDPPHQIQMVFRLVGVEDRGVRWLIPGASSWSAQPARRNGAELEGVTILTFSPREGATSTSFRVEIADEPFQTLLQKQDPDGMVIRNDGKKNIASISPVVETDGQSAVTTIDTLKDHERRVVAIDHDDNEHKPIQASASSTGAGPELTMMFVRFDLPIVELKEVQLQVRRFTRYAEFRDISIRNGNRTEPKVETGEIPEK